ncbi:conserved hypothetical protein [Paenibacillus curdlanolyticus YK9]|uniref:Uncharacterized protein n=1 Tax=Paenibacillus curdlanolyticus YK9 TaxID=717606 RepID=E0IDT7_9BACL|nr:hypothetical protein [Paenibacillus curdlanolyticus]EFM09291.1 conserved hypothetical protein [Paenibacillus curdlanolyticus YK9]
MNMIVNQQIEAWINDHLDLYNYAIQKGDTAWQQSILLQLSRKDEYVQALQEKQLKRELWGQFDLINQKLLGLFDEMRSHSQNQTYMKSIQLQMWELKRQRLEIVKQIKSVNP